MTRDRAEDRIQALLDVLPDAAVLVDREGRIVHASAQAEALFGYASGELLNQAVEVLMPERFRQQHVGDRQRYVLQPTKRSMGQRGRELWGRKKDGSEFPVDIAIGPYEESDTGLLVLAIIRDMTERDKQEQLIRKQAEDTRKQLEIMVGREGRVIEVKQEVNALLTELGRPPRYGV